MKDTKEIANLINLAKDAIDKCCFGPLFQYPDSRNITKREVNALAFSVFQLTLQQVLKAGLDERAKENGA